MDSDRLSPEQALYHHAANSSSGLPQLLADPAHRAHAINIFFFRHICRQILLCHQKNQLVLAGSQPQSRYGGRPFHIECQQHTGENGKAAQSQKGHRR